MIITINNTPVDTALGLTSDQFGNAVRCYLQALTNYSTSQLQMFKDDYEFWAGRLIATHGVSVEEVQVIQQTLTA